MMLEQVFDVPLGVRLMEKIPRIKNMSHASKNFWHKFSVLLLTFLSYASYHLARKPTSVVKSVLNHKNCSVLIPPPELSITSDNQTTWCSWHPFDGGNASTLLGGLDSAFLFAYAIGMYFTGAVGERMNLRYFLTIGMMMSGLFGFLFGLAYWANIHSLSFFIVVQILNGFFQSTGWPGCVAVVGNWFGKSKRGFIMGVWRSHHSVGNIFGTLIAAAFVEYNWGLSFAVPATVIVVLGLLLFLFLVPDPRAVGCQVPDHTGTRITAPESQIGLAQLSGTSESLDVSGRSEGPSSATMLKHGTPLTPSREKPISFWRAIQIPGVVEFALSLFFTKLINYTFLYWLPAYIKETELNMGAKNSADLSTLFDIGGIFGGIFGGLVSDITGMGAMTCGVSFVLNIPLLFLYRFYGSYSEGLNIFLLFLVGFFANVPYALITTAISADLGTHPVLKGSTRALSTVTAIIDGTGSIGAAVGPLMAGRLSISGWDHVFYALMISSFFGLVLLTRLIVNEVKQVCDKRSAQQEVSMEPVF